MTANVSWYIEGRIVMVTATGSLTIRDGIAISNQLIQLFESSTAPLVHVLVNQRDLSAVPQDLKQIVKATAFMRHPQMGWLLLFGTENRAVHFMAYLASQIARLRHRRFSTLDDALDFLYSVDLTLPSRLPHSATLQDKVQ